MKNTIKAVKVGPPVNAPEWALRYGMSIADRHIPDMPPDGWERRAALAKEIAEALFSVAVPAVGGNGDLGLTAGFLRNAGYTVTPPVDPAAAIPEPEVGQVWASPKPRIKPRTITRIVVSGWGSRTIVYDVPNDPSLKCYVEGWQEWAKRTNARPTPTTTTGAAQ